MLFSFLLTGAILAVTGFLAKAYPDLIAGYNLMEAEKKKNVDIAGLSAFIRNNLVGMGITLAILGFVAKWASWSEDCLLIIPVLVLGWLVPMVAIAQKYDHNDKK